jgi:GNAT superfamily N-acetyltransferase
MIPYRIDYTAKACFDVGNDGRYLTAVAGKIVDTRKGAVAGSITAFKVNTCQMRSVGIDPVTALSLEESTENYCHLFVNGHLDMKLQATAGLPGTDNILILDQLYVYPNYRGHMLGLAAMANTVSVWAPREEISLLKAFPLQFMYNISPADRHKYKGLETDPEKATRALIKYYAQLGFRQVGQTRFMVMRQIYETNLCVRLCGRQ